MGLLWIILVALYLGVGVLAFRECIRVHERDWPSLDIDGDDVFLFALSALVWPIYIPVMWGICGGLSWHKRSKDSKRNMSKALKNWAEKKED